MQSRPRRAENRVAELLSDFFVANGLQPVKRIPVLGRTGPDLTVNEVNLIVDVKSRQSVPQHPLNIVSETGKAKNGDLALFQLSSLQETLVLSQGIFTPCKTSKTVLEWLDHMHAWTQANTSGGISALVLHKPQMPYGSAVLVLYPSDVGLLQERILNPNVIGQGGAFMHLSETDSTITVHTPTGETRIHLTPTQLQKLLQWTKRRSQ